MSQPIKRAEIARHWGVSPAYVTITLKRHGGADLEFATLDEADRWRAVHAPAKPAGASKRAMFAGEHPQSSPENTAEDGEKNRGLPGTTSEPSRSTRGRGGNNGNSHGARLNVSAFVSADDDFDAVMLKQAERVPQIAYGLYELACGRADSVEIANATRNWNNAAKASATVREKYLEIQERTRALIPLDLVMDIVGTELQAVRSVMLKLGERYAARANPADPTLAKAVIDEAVDAVFSALANVEARTPREIATAPVAA